MPFIGNQPAESYSAFQKQDFTTSATTSYTLDHPVSNQNEIALFINFVRQEPTTAYTASGTSLTLTSATASSDDMYCIYLGKAVQTVNPASGSVGSSQVAASIITGQTAETSIATDDTVLIHDTSAGALRKMTRANFVSGIGGTNTPAFRVSQTSDQSIAHDTATKLTSLVEDYDTDNAFASDKFTVPSGEGGKYHFAVQLTYRTGDDIQYAGVQLRKNGANIRSSYAVNNDYNDAVLITVQSASASDYFEIYAEHQQGGNQNVKVKEFSGFKIIE